jgi:aspartate-semialdehyde dehydrogenase
VALVGSETLMGREIRDLLSGAHLPVKLRLVAGDEEETGRLTAEAGEPAIVWGLEKQFVADADVVLLAGSPESSRKALDLFEGSGEAIEAIDLTHVGDDRGNARIRAPLAEPPGYAAPRGAVHVIAHPAAIAITLVLRRIAREHPVRRSLVHVFEPASERGTPGVEEMQAQTVSLLSFKGLPKKVFDAQAAFNMLARYGEDAPAPLEDAELRLERHLATLLAAEGGAPMPSLRLIHAPVFHGHSFSMWVEFDHNPGVEALERALVSGAIDVRGAGVDAPDNVGMAGQGGVAVGAIGVDRNAPQACWLWMAADNLRLPAQNALELVRQLL